jgi:hypothetical protein
MDRPRKRSGPGQGAASTQPALDTWLRVSVHRRADHVIRQCCQGWQARAPGKRKRPAITPGALSTSSTEALLRLPDLLNIEAAEQYEHCLWEYHLAGECTPTCAWCVGGRWAA